MANCTKQFSSASSALKIATGVLTLALVLHIVAFSTPNWTSLRLAFPENGSNLLFPASDHGGLWQICSCFDALGDEFCSCYGRHGDPVWFKVTQTLQTFALIGYTISGIISLVQLFSEQDRKLKRINVFVIISAALCGVLGVIVFGIRSTDDYEDMAKYFDQLGMELHGTLDFSFYLCCVSGFLCLAVCTPLYIKDEKKELPPVTEELPVIYNNEGQMIIPSHIQGCICDIGQQPTGSAPTVAQAPYGAPPAYTVANQQEINDLPAPQFNDGIPYKPNCLE